MKHVYGALVVLFVATMGFSCAELGEAFDCVNVCDEYDICYEDAGFDVSQCTATCQDSADLDETFALQVQACEACIESMGCTDVFMCVDECTGIVP